MQVNQPIIDLKIPDKEKRAIEHARSVLAALFEDVKKLKKEKVIFERDALKTAKENRYFQEKNEKLLISTIKLEKRFMTASRELVRVTSETATVNKKRAFDEEKANTERDDLNKRIAKIVERENAVQLREKSVSVRESELINNTKKVEAREAKISNFAKSI